MIKHTYFNPSKMWDELSFIKLKLGRVGMGRILCGPSWHGPSWFWAELSCTLYLCVRDDSQLCLVCVHSLITRLQLKKMSVMYESAHVAITFQLLEISSIATPN